MLSNLNSFTKTKFSYLIFTLCLLCPGFETLSNNFYVRAKTNNDDYSFLETEKICGQWSQWSNCAWQKRQRGRKCRGSPNEFESEKCIDSVCGQWSQWTVCESEERYRGRACRGLPDEIQNEKCIDNTCEQWSQWSDCNNGQKIRTQKCGSNNSTESLPCRDNKVERSTQGKQLIPEKLRHDILASTPDNLVNPKPVRPKPRVLISLKTHENPNEKITPTEIKIMNEATPAAKRKYVPVSKETMRWIKEMSSRKKSRAESSDNREILPSVNKKLTILKEDDIINRTNPPVINNKPIKTVEPKTPEVIIKKKSRRSKSRRNKQESIRVKRSSDESERRKKNGANKHSKRKGVKRRLRNKKPRTEERKAHENIPQIKELSSNGIGNVKEHKFVIIPSKEQFEPIAATEIKHVEELKSMGNPVMVESKPHEFVKALEESNSKPIQTPVIKESVEQEPIHTSKPEIVESEQVQIPVIEEPKQSEPITTTEVTISPHKHEEIKAIPDPDIKEYENPYTAGDTPPEEIKAIPDPDIKEYENPYTAGDTPPEEIKAIPDPDIKEYDLTTNPSKEQSEPITTTEVTISPHIYEEPAHAPIIAEPEIVESEQVQIPVIEEPKQSEPAIKMPKKSKEELTTAPDLGRSMELEALPTLTKERQIQIPIAVEAKEENQHEDSELETEQQPQIPITEVEVEEQLEQTATEPNVEIPDVPMQIPVTEELTEYEVKREEPEPEQIQIPIIESEPNIVEHHQSITAPEMSEKPNTLEASIIEESEQPQSKQDTATAESDLILAPINEIGPKEHEFVTITKADVSPHSLETVKPDITDKYVIPISNASVSKNLQKTPNEDIKSSKKSEISGNLRNIHKDPYHDTKIAGGVIGAIAFLLGVGSFVAKKRKAALLMDSLREIEFDPEEISSTQKIETAVTIEESVWGID